MLLRDSKDDKYPYKQEYADFTDRPRWREYPGARYDALRLVVNVNEYFAYVDHIRKEFDYSNAVSRIARQSEDDSSEQHALRRVLVETRRCASLEARRAVAADARGLRACRNYPRSWIPRAAPHPRLYPSHAGRADDGDRPTARTCRHPHDGASLCTSRAKLRCRYYPGKLSAVNIVHYVGSRLD